VQPNQPQQDSLRTSVNLFTNLCMWIARPWSLAMSRPGTVGHRHARGVNTVIGLGLLYLWGVFSASEWLLYGGGLLALVAVAEHRLKSGPGRGVHSYSMGDSRLDRWFGEYQARAAEALLAVLLGVLLHPEDAGSGSYLIAAGVGHAVTVAFVFGRDEAVQQDLDDATIEGAARAGRRDDRPLF
jgi:hypothetical protein